MPDRRLVVDDQNQLAAAARQLDGLARARVRRRRRLRRQIDRERRPPPGSLSTRMKPPWLLTMASEVDRPRPVPLPTSLVVKKGSKMRSRISGGMPVPRVLDLEQHVGAGLGLDVRARERLVERDVLRGQGELPPSGIASRALTQRFSSTWWSCVGSPETVHRSSGSTVPHFDVLEERVVDDPLDVAQHVADVDLHAPPRRRGRTTAPAGPCRRRGGRSSRAVEDVEPFRVALVLAQHADRHQDRRQHVVQIVGDAAGQRADALHAAARAGTAARASCAR